MPEICRFYGIIIQLFYKDHAPPHFHATYGEFETEIGILNLEPIAGHLPRRAEVLVLDWATLHKEELMKEWELCRLGKPLFKINPLD